MLALPGDDQLGPGGHGRCDHMIVIGIVSQHVRLASRHHQADEFRVPRNQAQEITTQSWSNNAYQWQPSFDRNRSTTHNGLNQTIRYVSATFSYDAAANLASDGNWNWTYDDDNQLVTASKTGTPGVQLAYDPAGRMRQESLNGSINTQYLYDGTDLIAEYDAAGNLQRRYVHGPGVDEPIAVYQGSGTASKEWLYADHLGSIVASADAAGNATSAQSYGPFGEPSQTSGTRFKYTGQTFMPNLGLYYCKARFYAPGLGRFLQTDPVGYADDLNLYAYARNGPVSNYDPTGLDTRIAIGYTQTPVPGTYHQVVILTDTVTGTQFATRAGPESQGIYGSGVNSIASVGGGSISALARNGGSGGFGFGKIVAQSGTFDPGFRDAPTSVVKYQSVATISRDFSESVANAIDFAKSTNHSAIPYWPLGPNSNSYASSFVQSLTGIRPIPPLQSPGHAMSLAVGNLSYGPSPASGDNAAMLGASGANGDRK